MGLTSRRWQSGEVDYGGRISKMGDSLLRHLLYEAACTKWTRSVYSLLTRAGPAHPLKDWARKLAVILHKMLITGEPFRWPQRKEVSAEA